MTTNQLDIEWLQERVRTFFGADSQELFQFIKMRNQLVVAESRTPSHKDCQTCKCPVCGRTHADAAKQVRSKRARTVRQGMFIIASQPTSDCDDGGDVENFKDDLYAGRIF